jgi:hypothetical protein
MDAGQSNSAITPTERAKRQFALKSVIGSLRISGMELEPAEFEIVNRFARGETDLATMHAQMEALIEADL